MIEFIWHQHLTYFATSKALVTTHKHNFYNDTGISVGGVYMSWVGYYGTDDHRSSYHIEPKELPSFYIL